MQISVLSNEEQPVLPMVSIIVPVYNVEKYIQECIDSILAQTFVNFECILVIDCSPDNCLSICNEYAKRDKRIKVINNESNIGASLSRKAGLDASIGNYILFVDSDDWIELSTIEKMYQKAINENCDIVHSRMIKNIGRKELKDTSVIIYDKNSIYKQLISSGEYSPSLCNKLVKRSIYMKVIFPVYQYNEDRLIILQSIYYAEKIEYIDDFLYHYRMNPDSSCESDKSINKRCIDEYKNFMVLLNFLAEKKLIPFLESEVITRVNKIKLSFIKNKELQYLSNEVFNCLYPESTNNIFSKKNKIRFNNKLLLYFWFKNSPLFNVFVNLYIGCEFLIKKIIKFIVSWLNLRSW